LFSNNDRRRVREGKELKRASSDDHIPLVGVCCVEIEVERGGNVFLCKKE
jgi:hypothetical protein